VDYVDPKGCYSASKAIDYAKRWWNDKNPLFYAYITGGDCANFVSQCLHNGGYKMDNIWYSYRSTNKKKGWYAQPRIVSVTYNYFSKSYGFHIQKYWYNVSDTWNTAKLLFDYLVYNKKYTTLTITNKRSLQDYINAGLIKAGYPAFFSRYGRREGISHAVLIGKVTKSDVYYYAHSSNRNAEVNAQKGQFGFRYAFSTNETIYVVLIK
jgi:hypothetical protein